MSLLGSGSDSVSDPVESLFCLTAAFNASAVASLVQGVVTCEGDEEDEEVEEGDVFLLFKTKNSFHIFLLYLLLVFEEKSLVIPHPELHKRKFVLEPLNDIAKDFEHYGLKKTVSELLDECEDDSEIESVNIWLKNPKKNFGFSNYNFIETKPIRTEQKMTLI